jgi:hypothetical protein
MDIFKTLAEALGLRRTPEKRPKARQGAASNKRAVMRKRMRLLDGFIVTDGMLTPRACTLRDVSALGACVEIWDDAVKPALLRDRLTLYIPSDGKEVDCDIVWKRANAIGLKFASPFREPRRKYA